MAALPLTNERPPPTRVRGLRGVVATSAAVYLAFVVLRLLAHGWDPTAFVAAGDRITDPVSAPETLLVQKDTAGYDGQFFYRMARAPLSTEPEAYGVEFDRPAYRQSRLGYPLMAWALSGGGRAGLVPWALIGVNLAAVVGVAAMVASMARDAGRSPWFGLLVAGWSGLLVCLARDLSEVLATLLLVATVAALRRDSRWGAMALLTAAVLTRETTLLLAAGIVGAGVLGRLPLRGWWASFADRRRLVPVSVGLVPLAVYGGWQVLLRSWWDSTGAATEEATAFFALPIGPLVGQFWTWLSAPDVVGLYQLVQVVLLLLVVVSLASALRDAVAGLPHERLALVAGLAMLSMVPTWERSIVFLRWASDVVLLGTAIALMTPRVRIPPIARAVGLLWASTAVTWVLIV